MADPIGNGQNQSHCLCGRKRRAMGGRKRQGQRQRPRTLKGI